MKKLRTGGLVAVICVIGMGIVLAERNGRFSAESRSHGKDAHLATATTPATDALTNTDTEPTPQVMPEQVKFKFLFEHLVKIKDKPGSLRNYQEKTGLPDAAFSALVQLALEHEQQAALIDQQAKVIINNFHAQYPRNLPPGMAPPPPPQELVDLQDQRDSLALRYKDRLMTQLGTATYDLFRQFIDDEFRPKMQAATQATPANLGLPGMGDK
jgi:hypothetical protein